MSAGGAGLDMALVGYGRMGRAVEALAREAGHRIATRIGRDDAITAQTLGGADVAVEFTRPEAALDNIRAISAAGIDVVVGTTGWYDRLDEARTAIGDAGTGMIFAPNFSLGVQVFLRAARELAELVDALEEYDVYVHEAHHRHKVDHPSGTARRLADVLVEALARKRRWKEGPAGGEGAAAPDGPAGGEPKGSSEGPAGAPAPSTLWVTSTRAGEIPGTHTVGVEGPDDRIEFTHEARGRSGFARGAVRAAEWIRGRRGVFTVDDMLADRLRGPRAGSEAGR